MEKGDEIGVVRLDPETEFLYSKQATTGNEWELFKENVKPIKRGRNVTLLNQALKSHSDSQLKKSLLHTRRYFNSIPIIYMSDLCQRLSTYRL